VHPVLPTHDGASGWTLGILAHFLCFEFFLLQNIVHARPSAMLRERKPLGNPPYKLKYLVENESR